jgi:hypothetical protein
MTTGMYQGRIQDFKLGGGRIETNCAERREGEHFAVFRVKNHDFTPKNHIFSTFRGRAPGASLPWIRPCVPFVVIITMFFSYS